MKFIYKTETRHTDLENELMVAIGEWWGEGTVREFEIDIHTLLYLEWITILLYSTEKSAQCYTAAWMGGEFVEEWLPV